MITDGLWDVYDDCHMGSFAELCAETLGIDRAEQVRSTLGGRALALSAACPHKIDAQRTRIDEEWHL
eukprot:4016826-Pleurochrysis_carterae.AAC.1